MSDKLTLVQKLVKVYEEVDHIEKRGTNREQNYKFVRSADLAHAIRNALLKLGVYAQVVFTHISTYSYTTAKGTHMNATDVRCDIEFYDGDDRGIMPFHASGLGTGADTGDKAMFKAQTGALKYALRNAFLVPDDADPEADESTDKATQTASTSTARPTNPPQKAQPPKAEIPNSATPSGHASATAKPSTTEASPKTTESATSTTDSSLPTEDELKGLRNNFKLLGDDLATGGLKASKGLPINKKVLAYLLKTTGAPAADKVTRAQWNTFFSIVNAVKSSDGGIKELARLVDESTGGKS
jgi:hypothetical protein